MSNCEKPACSDGLDNDGDGKIDKHDDGCMSVDGKYLPGQDSELEDNCKLLFEEDREDEGDMREADAVNVVFSFPGWDSPQIAKVQEMAKKLLTYEPFFSSKHKGKLQFWYVEKKLPNSHPNGKNSCGCEAESCGLKNEAGVAICNVSCRANAYLGSIEGEVKNIFEGESTSGVFGKLGTSRLSKSDHANTFVHEFGHQFGHLIDEYTEAGVCGKKSEFKYSPFTCFKDEDCERLTKCEASETTVKMCGAKADRSSCKTPEDCPGNCKETEFLTCGGKDGGRVCENNSACACKVIETEKRCGGIDSGLPCADNDDEVCSPKCLFIVEGSGPDGEKACNGDPFDKSCTTDNDCKEECIEIEIKTCGGLNPIFGGDVQYCKNDTTCPTCLPMKQCGGSEFMAGECEDNDDCPTSCLDMPVKRCGGDKDAKICEIDDNCKEYSKCDGAKSDSPRPPNCAPTEEIAEDWWGDIDELDVGNFKGCSYTEDNIRPTNNSVMRNSHEHPEFDGFGPVNVRILEQKLGIYTANQFPNTTSSLLLPGKGYIHSLFASVLGSMWKPFPMSFIEVDSKETFFASLVANIGLSNTSTPYTESALALTLERNSNGEFTVISKQPVQVKYGVKPNFAYGNFVRITIGHKEFTQTFAGANTEIAEDFSGENISLVDYKVTPIDRLTVLVGVGDIDLEKSNYNIDVQTCNDLDDDDTNDCPEPQFKGAVLPMPEKLGNGPGRHFQQLRGFLLGY